MIPNAIKPVAADAITEVAQVIDNFHGIKPLTDEEVPRLASMCFQLAASLKSAAPDVVAAVRHLFEESDPPRPAIPNLPVSLLLLALALIQPSCVSVDTLFGQGRTFNGKPAIVVDISEKKALVAGKVYPVVTGQAGIGGQPGSGKTPLSAPDKPLVVIAKYRNTSKGLGPSLHIGGTDISGRRQDGREILIHRAFSTTTPPEKRRGTGGCVGFSYTDMPRIYAATLVGTPVVIRE